MLQGQSPAVNAHGKHRYHCRVTRASHDTAAPEANTRVLTLRADSKEQAEQLIHAVTRARVTETWRDERFADPAPSPTAPGAVFADVLTEVNARFPGMLQRGAA